MKGNIMTKDELITYLTIRVGKQFRSFGGGRGGNGMNPLAEALKDSPLQFAAGVDVKEVIEFIMKEIL